MRRARLIARKDKVKRAVLLLFSEIKSYAFFIRLFEIFLGVIIAGMIAVMASRFFILPLIYFIPLPILYFILRIYESYRYDDIPAVEKKFSAFKEQLVTLRDNLHKEDEMVEELEKDVIFKASRIKTHVFLNKRAFFSKAILILVFFMFSSAVAPYNYTDIPSLIGPVVHDTHLPNNLPWFQKASLTGSGSPGNTRSIHNIFGNQTVLDQGTREIPLELQAARDSLDLNAVTNIQQNNFNSYAPTKIYVQGATYYQDTIPQSKYNVVKNNFNQK